MIDPKCGWSVATCECGEKYMRLPETRALDQESCCICRGGLSYVYQAVDNIEDVQCECWICPACDDHYLAMDGGCDCGWPDNELDEVDDGKQNCDGDECCGGGTDCQA